MPDTPEDVVKEARAHLDDPALTNIVRYETRKIIASLCGEVEALRAKLKDPCLVAGYHVCGGAHNLSDLTKD